MLIEQAFMALPEFLLGTPYEQYHHEGTILTAYSMAVLQELNGRNVNNPISALRGEVTYPIAQRYRADLHLDLDRLNVLNDDLQRYGIRKDNWLEAKFFRTNANGNPTVDKLKATLLLGKDLLRLAALPPDVVGFPPQSARYLLHVYQSHPTLHTASRKNRQDDIPGFVRSWVKKMRMPGRQSLSSFNFATEVGQFDTVVGANLREIELTLKITNFAYEPIHAATDGSNYWMYLTRIDEVEISRGQRSLAIKHDMVSESGEGQFIEINTFIAGGFAA